MLRSTTEFTQGFVQAKPIRVPRAIATRMAEVLKEANAQGQGINADDLKRHGFTSAQIISYFDEAKAMALAAASKDIGHTPDYDLDGAVQKLSMIVDALLPTRRELEQALYLKGVSHRDIGRLLNPAMQQSAERLGKAYATPKAVA